MAIAEASDAPRDDTWLTRAERGECAALATPAARADYRAARLAARLVLVHGDGDALRRVAVRRRPDGPPAVWRRREHGRWHRAPDALSLAHRDGRAAAVLAQRASIRAGVDVERIDAVAPEHVRYFASAEEYEAGPRDATALWALKEAAWKALRLGRSCPLRALALEFDASGCVCAVRVRRRRLAARAVLSRPWPRHLLAIVLVEGA